MHLSADAQNDCAISFSGVVLSEDGSALDGASIQISSEQTGTVADDHGGFLFKNLCPGNYY